MKSRVKDSRRAIFEATYERHNREVWALAYARWLNADLAQDISEVHSNVYRLLTWMGNLSDDKIKKIRTDETSLTTRYRAIARA